MSIEALLVSNNGLYETLSSASNQEYYSHEPSIDTINSSLNDMGNVDEICKNSTIITTTTTTPTTAHSDNNILSKPLTDNNLHHQNLVNISTSSVTSKRFMGSNDRITKNSTTKSRKRWRKPRVCKNKEEAETQRMKHIAVERNRRQQMNEYLAVLRSLMPQSYVQRGDQASIVGGAIEFVKELEQLLQSLEAKKHQLQQEPNGNTNNNSSSTNFLPTPFMKFFNNPQFSWCQNTRNSSDDTPVIANIEVSMIETHANIRILSQRRPKQLLKIVIGIQNLKLTILHLNLTTLDPFVLYSFSAKVEEGCHLNSVDDISSAVHHMLRVTEEEAATDIEQ